MSGGHFGYSQHRIHDIITDIKEIINHNDSIEKDRYGDVVGYHFKKDTIEEFKIGTKVLEMAAVYAQRIDWLVSGDDGEESFHERLEEELKGINFDKS